LRNSIVCLIYVLSIIFICNAKAQAQPYKAGDILSASRVKYEIPPTTICLGNTGDRGRLQEDFGGIETIYYNLVSASDQATKHLNKGTEAYKSHDTNVMKTEFQAYTQYLERFNLISVDFDNAMNSGFFKKKS
jgi:hypothetical protein